MNYKVFTIIIGGLIVVVAVTYYLLDRMIRKQKGRIHVKKSSNFSLKGIFWLYRLFSRTPLLKRFFFKIRNYLEINYPADDMSIRRKATLTMLKCVGGAIAVMTVVLVMGWGDWFFICMGFFLTYFIFTFLIGSAQERLDNKLLVQLGDFITNIRHHYSANGNVEDAIYDTLDETPYEMGLHATKISQIIGSTHVEELVNAYTDIAPNRFILTLVAVCATIKEYGDKKLDDGQSLFLTNINYLKEEINVEMIRRKKTKFMFSGLTVLSILPLFFLKAIEWFGTTNVPEMATFYQGTAGTVVMAIIFFVSIVTYQMVLNLRDGAAADDREHRFIERILSIGIINRFITVVINKDYTRHLRIDDGLKMTGDKIGVKGFLVKRILFGLTAILLINIVIFTSEWRSKHNLVNDFATAFESSIVPNEEYRETMRETAREHMEYQKQLEDTPANRELVASQVREETGLQETLIQEIVAEIFARIASYKNVYYRWWFILLNVAGFYLGYFLPYGLLLYQLRIVKMDMEDEVIQFQTIVLILMHVDGIMIDTVLEWMERFAFCFKPSIQECIISLEYSTQKSLQKMKNSETFPPFRRFVDNLLMVDDEDILTAFSEIETDREYYKEKRKTDNEIIASQKAEIGKMVSFVPLLLALIAYLIVPFGMYAMDMLKMLNLGG